MTDHASLRAAILAAVPADGGSIGNQSLFEQLSSRFPSLDEESYWQVRDALIAEGLLAKGRGRGGSVRRAEAKLSTGMDASTLAEQALNEARAIYAP